MSEPAHKPEGTTSAPTTDRQDYLRKRHTSEGARRRKLGIADALDAELDERNTRTWEAVLTGCYVAANVDLAEIPRDFRSHAPSRDALLAAFRICNRRYGIPVARLAELSGKTRSHVSRSLRIERESIGDIIDAWRLSGGPETVGRVECVPILVTKDAALALAKAARGSGDSPIVLASAAILAALAG